MFNEFDLGYLGNLLLHETYLYLKNSRVSEHHNTITWETKFIDLNDKVQKNDT